LVRKNEKIAHAGTWTATTSQGQSLELTVDATGNITLVADIQYTGYVPSDQETTWVKLNSGATSKWVKYLYASKTWIIDGLEGVTLQIPAPVANPSTGSNPSSGSEPSSGSNPSSESSENTSVPLTTGQLKILGLPRNAVFVAFGVAAVAIVVIVVVIIVKARKSAVGLLAANVEEAPAEESK